MKKKKKQKIKNKKHETFHIINNDMINDHIYHKLYNDIFEIKNKIQNNHNIMNEKKVNIYNSKNLTYLGNLTNTIDLRINDNLSTLYNDLIHNDQNIIQHNDINNNQNYTNQNNNNITNQNQSCLLLCQLHCTIVSRQHEIADTLYKKLNFGNKNVTLPNNIKKNTNIYLFNLYFDENMKTLLYIIPSKKIYKSLNSNWKVGLKCRIQKPLCATNYNAYSARIRRIIYDPQHLWKCVTVKKDTQKFNKNSINQKVNFWELTKKKNV
ncbi:hypothetical protein PFUGPA_04010 [Plasmodium falciparum Palo Alto/Uganda]|nr:hypothetical protein PFUGPA_04010 [Plasmodium falciparum Palo Alto/Uganda]